MRIYYLQILRNDLHAKMRMTFRYDICNRLSREHQQVIRLQRRFSDFLASAGADAEPDWSKTDVHILMSDLRFAFESEIPAHFMIEEEELFPELADRGIGDIIDLLSEEHRMITGLIAEVAPIISKAARERVTGSGEWKTLFEKGGILASTLSMHAEKEESGFLPAIDRLIDRERADRVFRHYQQM
jgi:hemerythrin-like domain-containing protein